MIKRIILTAILLLAIANNVFAYDPQASQIKTNTTSFTNNLSSADTTVQKALETLDNLTIPTQYTDALARAAISETITGISYDNSTGVLSLTTNYVIPTTTEETNWNTAYSWGNHANAGYLTVESDPNAWLTTGNQSGLTGTKSGTYNLSTSGTLASGPVSITSGDYGIIVTPPADFAYTDQYFKPVIQWSPLVLRDYDLTGSEDIPCGIVKASTTHSGAVFYNGVGTADSTTIFGGGVSADTYRRIKIRANGAMLWGPGSASSDTYLYRYTTSTLKLDSNGIGGGADLIVTGKGTFTGLVSPYIAPSADSTTAFQIRKADKTTAVLNVDTTNGYVSTGTTTPKAPFDLTSAANCRFDLYDSNGYGGYRRFSFFNGYSAGSENDLRIQIRTDAGTLIRSLVTIKGASGNVGIGTVPNYKLDVAGQVNIVSSVYAPLNVTRATATGSSSVWGAQKFVLNQADNTASGPGTYFMANNSAGTSTFIGQFGGYLGTVTAGSEVGQIIFGAAWHGADPSSQKHLTITATGANSGDVSVQNGNLLIPNGNVSIKTTSSTYPFQVAGDISIGTSAADATVHFYSGYGFVLDSGATAKFRMLPFGNDIYFQNTNTSGNIYFTGLAAATLTGNVIFKTSGTTQFTGGNIVIGGTLATARLMLPAGTSTASTAPLKFTAGTLNTVAEAGAIEYTTGTFYLQSDNLVMGDSSNAGSYKFYIKSSDLVANFSANLATSSTSGRAFVINTNGEAYSRTVFYTNGSFGFGSGSATRDIFLGRSGTNTMKLGTDYDLTGAGNLLIGSTGKIQFGASTEYINSANANHLDFNATTSIDMNADMDISAKNIITDTTTGTKIATLGGASGQKLGFFGQTPIVQPVLATGASHTVDDVITVLQNLGLCRQS